MVAGVSCARFRGHRNKVFSEPEGDDATTEAQSRGREAGIGAGRFGSAGGARSRRDANVLRKLIREAEGDSGSASRPRQMAPRATGD
jgi:hypothetical protein